MAGVLEELEPALSDIVVTTNSSPRSMPAAELAELAIEIFGEDRVQVAERLDDAIDLAASIADVFDAEAVARGLPGGAAVLVTGSVVTAGDAQLLLAPAQAVGASANPRRAGAGDAGQALVYARRALMRRLCGTVLAMEAVIALLAIVPAKVLGHTSAGTAAAVCGAVALVAIVLSGSRRQAPVGALRGLGVPARRHRLRRPAADDVRARGDLRRALVHRHLAGAQVGARTRPDPVQHDRLTPGEPITPVSSSVIP